MVFSSAVFLFLFLPLFLAAYYLTPLRFRSYAILAGSYVFYGWWRVDYLVLVAGISLWSWIAGHAILRARTARGAKRSMILGVGGNLLALGYFKYFNFLADNLNAFLAQPFVFEHVILPIGISFHVFQSVSYVIDVYRRDVPPACRLVDFLAFTSLFPQLIAGPVLRYKDLADQFISRTHDWPTFNEGTRRFALGFVKKVLIADTVAPLVALGFGQDVPTFAESWLGALAFTVQLYFDFSGYSDMAIGLGLMMGFRFTENFNRPYTSRSITEFWKRWHISLSTLLRDYLYIPLGGNRRGSRRTTINLLLTMVLGGFWHGANWTYVLWGAWHGGWMALERGMGSKQRDTVWPRAVALPLTFLVVVLGWVMFWAETVGAALQLYTGLAGLNGFGFRDETVWQLSRLQLATLALGFGVIFAEITSNRHARGSGHPVDSRFRGSDGKSREALVNLALPLLFLLAVLRLSAESYSPFLYFQF